jgi:hypothetical protein
VEESRTGGVGSRLGTPSLRALKAADTAAIEGLGRPDGGEGQDY